MYYVYKLKTYTNIIQTYIYYAEMELYLKH